ncbi:MAG: hypothetical protein ACI4JN_04060 [Ruminococcus sp.]
MLKETFEKLKNLMKGENSVRLVVIAGLAGLAFILMSSWFPDDKGEESQKLSEITSDNTSETDQTVRYTEILEERLEKMLSEIDGVGSCSVMITVSGGVSYSYAQNAEQQIGENVNEIKKQFVVLDKDSGDSPLLESVRNPEIIGVIIACEGGEHNVVRECVISAAGAVLGIPSNRICVTKKISESGD